MTARVTSAPRARGRNRSAASTTIAADRREAAALRDLLRCAADWTWEVDTEGRLTHVSTALQAIASTPTHELIGRRLGEIGRWPDARDLSETEAFRQHEPFRDAVLLLGDGKRRQLLAGVPVFDECDGRFTGYRGIARDAPASSAEEELERSRDELAAAYSRLDEANSALSQTLVESEAAAQAKAEFLAKMSHELRTPLNAVLGFSDAVAGGELRGDAARYEEIFADVATSGRQLLDLIDDVLDSAKIASGSLDLTLAPVPLDRIIAGALSEVMETAAARRLDTRAVAVPADIDLMVDKAVATRIFTNLLRNAVTFAPEGGAVGVRVDASDPGRVAVAVWDTGPGIPQARREHVFSPFASDAHDVYVRAANGAGLGLSQARGWAVLMGGWVEIRPPATGGSEFVVRLPVAQAHRKTTRVAPRRVA